MSDDHEDAAMAAFAEVLSIEDDIRLAQVELDEAERRITPLIQNGKLRLAEAWDKLAAIMAETGEYELILPLDERNDYKVEWSRPRECVKVASPEAVPEEFVKLERRPLLKEIGDHLRDCVAGGAEMPNWASFERGEPRLQWKTVKHKVR